MTPNAMQIIGNGERGKLYYIHEPCRPWVDKLGVTRHERMKEVDRSTFWQVFAAAGEPSYQEGSYWAFETRPPQPQTPRPATVDAAVAQMVAQGKANQPALAKRLDAAAALLLDGRVELAGDEARLGPYTITADACTCPDHQHRGGWCKHRLAVRMARHLAANEFDLPRPEPVATTPQISAANLALIASGRVIDDELRSRLACRRSEHGAHTAALRMLGNGAKALPADIARRAGIAKQEANEGGR